MTADPAAGTGDTAATESNPNGNAAAGESQETAATRGLQRIAAMQAADDDTGETAGMSEPSQPEGADPNGNTEKENPNAESDRSAEEQSREQKAPGAQDDPPEVSDEERKAWPKDALNRIHKATAKRNEERDARTKAEQRAADLEAKLKDTEAKLNGTQPFVITPTRSNPLADVNTPEQLQTAVSELEEGLEWATRNADGAADVVIGKDAAGKEIVRDYSREEMAEQRLFFERALRRSVPERAAYIERAQVADSYVAQRYPEIVAKETPEAKEIADILQKVPEITRLPHWRLALAWAIRGRKAEAEDLAAAEKANGNSNGKGKTDNVRPELKPFLERQPAKAPGVSQPRSGGDNGAGANGNRGKQSARIDEAKDRVLAGEGEEAEEDFIASLRSASHAPSRAALV